MLWSILCGLLFALDLYCWHTSIRFIGPGLATILGNFQVFALAAFGLLFLREKVHLRFLLAIPVALLGLCLIVGVHSHQLSPEYRMGIVLGLMTAVCYSGFLLILRKLQAEGEQFPPFQPDADLRCQRLFSRRLPDPDRCFFCHPRPDQLACPARFGTAQPDHRLDPDRQRHAPDASLTGLALLFQPALSFVWDVLFFQRSTTFINWLGVLITLAAIYLGIQGSRR